MKLVSRLSYGKIFAVFAWSLSSLSQVANCEIRAFNLLLEPASEYIHFVEGFLLTPGYIDLSELLFVTTQDQGPSDPGSISGETKDGGNRRKNHRTLAADNSSSNSGTDYYMDGSALDIAVFHLPEECASTRAGCDWTELGVGAKSDDGVLRYCCSSDAITMGLCAGTQFGRLIMDNEKFVGKHRLMNVPSNGNYSNHLRYGRFEETEESGRYVVVFANCNDEGRRVIVEGNTVWRSKHGYLPGDLFGLMYFYGFLFLVYFAFLTWYGITMKMFEDANIPIQSWIFGTICMGTLEVFFRSGDLFVWNEDGSRFWVAYYVGVIIGALKRGISRCLLVMVALGWGVIRDELGPIMKKINLLGGLYIVVSLVNDIMTEVMVAEIQRMNQEEEEEIFDILSILGFVIVLIDVMFYFWIIDSLSGTMEYLENMKQTRKLLRYLRLRCILMFSILAGVIWAVFGIVDTYDQGIVTQEATWVIDAAMEMNYLFVLIAVAMLWRPQANAKEYAYVMELPAMSGALDDDDSEGAIELSGVVPSAADDSDEDVFDDEVQS
uniref:GOST seven transmembrane domain-containing protein n=1 Tax=Pseudo-nitzschia australis TaxID=44445 RepID=A0A7S4ADS0_9STRA|mmetsp:Transcript_21882/g.47616  ORF Transcript_21882/g.47616 Transcript_21882/m.47616 type:complete len:550 (+) Transcript_21882:107-1756(+)